MRLPILLGLAILLFENTQAQIVITVDASSTSVPISPYIYGKNNNVSDNPSKPTASTAWDLYNAAGITIYRENSGNNCTKYNWREKLSSHPDWYNNVYDHDWDYEAGTILQNTSAQAFFGFQLLGKVASNKDNNFDDWNYNGSAWWSGTNQNLAGGGEVLNTDPLSVTEGDASLYTKDWPADSSVAILPHWFDNLGYDSTRVRYWNMDNEPEIWNGTHSDVQGEIEAEVYMQRYFEVAKQARAAFPGIKLVGPAFTNEWQWYTWNNSKVDDNGTEMPWFEYFIKRIGEEQQATGIRLLDVLDYHFYPGTQDDASLTLELHKIWYDQDWDYSKANGLKTSGSGGWDNSLTKEYIFARSEAALDQYLGINHGVTLGVSECGAIDEEPNVVACWYASQLGVFAENEVELLTPWDWYEGMFEVLHLFTQHYGSRAIPATSEDADNVGSFASWNESGDTLSIALINRNQTSAQTASIDLQNFALEALTVPGYQLSDLPTSETFVSRTDNALSVESYSVVDGKIETVLPSLSVTIIKVPNGAAGLHDQGQIEGLELFPNPASDQLTLHLNSSQNVRMDLFNSLGQTVLSTQLKNSESVDVSNLANGQYTARIQLEHNAVQSIPVTLQK